MKKQFLCEQKFYIIFFSIRKYQYQRTSQNGRETSALNLTNLLTIRCQPVAGNFYLSGLRKTSKSAIGFHYIHLFYDMKFGSLWKEKSYPGFS